MRTLNIGRKRMVKMARDHDTMPTDGRTAERTVAG